MNELNPGQIFQLSKNAYTTKKGDSPLLRRELDIELPFVNIDSLRIITATSGLITPVSSAPHWRHRAGNAQPKRRKPVGYVTGMWLPGN